MKNRVVATFFAFLFMGLTIAPSVIIILDDSFDTSIFYSLTEEEEKGKEKETNKNIEVIVFKTVHLESYSLSLLLKNNLGYYFKKYPKPHLNLISPPPEVQFI